MIGRGLKIAVPTCISLIAGGIVLALGMTKPQTQSDRIGRLKQAADKLRPLHTRLGEPQPGDWLTQHQETGQTFDEYLACDPVMPDERRKTIYIQPLGDLTPTQVQVVALTADFLGRYFSLPVKQLKPLPLSVIPARARRTHPTWGDKQILTSYVLEDVLKPSLPKDAFACVALTGSDLWPGPGWNFVFGQASLRDRVGVWSIYRNGDPAAGADEFRLCLLRTLKTAAHELGHMGSMLHCTRYECGMCGSNHREESDRRPLALCPECVAKVWWATGADPVDRFVKLLEFCREQQLAGEAEFYEKSIRALGGRVPQSRPASRPQAPR